MKNRFIYNCGIMPFYGEQSKVYFVFQSIWIARSILRNRLVIEFNFSKK